jgi:outer membrane protein TolC
MSLCAAIPAHAQGLPLTLEDAIARGLAQAPRLAEARARESASQAAVAARESLRLPSVTASAGVLRTNHVEEFGVPQAGGTVRILFPDIPTNYRARAEAGVPIYTSGRVEALVASAEGDARAAAAETRGVTQDLTLDIVRAYWAVVTAGESVAVLERTQQRMDAWVGDVGSRVDAGVLPPNDLLSAQAQRARQAVQLIQARNAASAARMDLARLIGVGLDQPLSLTTPVDRPLPAAAAVVGADPSALAARARESRPERAALLERQSALRASATAASASLKPQVSGVAAIEPARPNARFVPRADEWRTAWDLGVNVSWPLFDGGRARADRAAALAQSDAVASRVVEFDALVDVDVRQRLLDLESGRAALDASAEALAAATEARRVIEERFAAGVATATDVLDAQIAVLDVELERTRLAAALRLAEARLLRTVGGL